MFVGVGGLWSMVGDYTIIAREFIIVCCFGERNGTGFASETRTRLCSLLYVINSIIMGFANFMTVKGNSTGHKYGYESLILYKYLYFFHF